MSRGLVLGLAGQIASGKSTVAKAVAAAIPCPHVSFGNYVRSVAKRKQIYDDRNALQDLGQYLLETKGAEQFCIDVLDSEAPDYVPGDDLIIEGVRHVEVTEALTRLVYPAAFALVFVLVDDLTRRQRLALRDGKGDAVNLAKVDSHATERQVHGELRNRADLALISTRASGELVRAVLAWRNSERAFWSEQRV